MGGKIALKDITGETVNHERRTVDYINIIYLVNSFTAVT